jgi:hypothetical protein
MGLSWEVIKIENYKDTCYRPAGEYEHSDDGYVLRLTTERVIWACEAVEMSGIKPDHVDEFYTRYLMFSRAIQRDSREQWLTLADIEAHVGIWTNVGTKSWKHFDEKIGEIMRHKAEWQVTHERESAEGGEE